MPLKKLDLDPAKFQETIDSVESKFTFRSEQHLWESFCETQWAKSQARPLTAPTARQYARDLNLQWKTRSTTIRGKRRIVRTSEGKGRVWIYRLTVSKTSTPSEAFGFRTYKTYNKIRSEGDIENIEGQIGFKILAIFELKE